jgi:hypothetical protein
LSVVPASPEGRSALRWLGFVLLLVALGQGEFKAAVHGAEHYREIQKDGWDATNVWLESAECARATGAWLSICDNGKLIPISEYAIADDPGHALFLDILAIASQRKVSLADVAYLNIGLNSLGLVLLTSFLFAVRAYVTSIVLLALGPVVFLAWIGTSPHWGFIGVASMAAVLPLALVAREKGFLSDGVGRAYLGAGLVGLAIAALVREPIGMMALLVTMAAIVVLARRRDARLRLLIAGALVIAASAAPGWAVLARDASFAMEPAQHVQTHGISHTLYTGLGVVENKFGIRYEDAYGATAAKAIDPDVVFGSPGYFRIMWRLFADRLVEDPAEVARIFMEKARLILTDRVLDSAPPLWIVLALALAHVVLATIYDIWRRIGFGQGLIVEGLSLAFVGLFVLQGIVAHPNRMFAVPAGAFLLVLLGVMLEFFCRAAWVRLLASPRLQSFR